MPGPTPERNLFKRLLQLEQQLRQLLRTFSGKRDAQLVPRPQLRIGIIVSEAEVPANTFGVVFCDGDFIRTEGYRIPTLALHDIVAPQVVAHNLCGNYLRYGTKVFVAEIGRRWWIIRDFGPSKWIQFHVSAGPYGFDEDDDTVDVIVDLAWDGEWPGDAFPVINSCNMFSGANGVCGLAVYDDVRDVYRIVQLKCATTYDQEQ